MGRQGWWDEADVHVLGQSHAITTVSGLRRGGRHAVRAYFALGRRVPALGRRLRSLSFIHAARWTVVERIAGGPPLKAPLLLFESNFNGDWAQYIDAFAYVIPERMAGVWWTSWGWPGARPAGPFKAYIRRNEHDALHFWSATPDTTVTEIRSALWLREQFDAFAAEADGMTAAEFGAAWPAFLTRVQTSL